MRIAAREIFTPCLLLLLTLSFVNSQQTAEMQRAKTLASEKPPAPPAAMSSKNATRNVTQNKPSPDTARPGAPAVNSTRNITQNKPSPDTARPGAPAVNSTRNITQNKPSPDTARPGAPAVNSTRNITQNKPSPDTARPGAPAVNSTRNITQNKPSPDTARPGAPAVNSTRNITQNKPSPDTARPGAPVVNSTRNITQNKPSPDTARPGAPAVNSTRNITQNKPSPDTARPGAPAVNSTRNITQNKPSPDTARPGAPAVNSTRNITQNKPSPDTARPGAPVVNSTRNITQNKPSPDTARPGASAVNSTRNITQNKPSPDTARPGAPAVNSTRNITAGNLASDVSTNADPKQNNSSTRNSEPVKSPPDANGNASSTSNAAGNITSIQSLFNKLKASGGDRTTVLRNQDLFFKPSSKRPRGELVLRKILTLSSDVLFRAIVDSVRSLSGIHAKTYSLKKLQKLLGARMRQHRERRNLTRCLSTFMYGMADLTMKIPWALELVDSFGRPGPAVSENNLRWPGSIETCEGLGNFQQRGKSMIFNYCNAFPTSSSATKFHISKYEMEKDDPLMFVGLCFHDFCSESDIRLIINEVLGHLNESTKFNVQCVHRNQTLDQKATAAIAVGGSMVFLVLLGTIVDVYFVLRYGSHEDGNDSSGKVAFTSADEAKQSMGAGVRMLMALSLYSNGAKLVSVVQSEDSLTCIHGIRYLSAIWVLLGHTFWIPQLVGANIHPFWETATRQWIFKVVLNTALSAETFFTISGLLVAYTTLKELDRNNGKLNWLGYYLRRFWRLTPAYMLVLMVYVWLSPYVGQGPLWIPGVPDRDNCKKYWWANLLYINNFFRMDDTCMAQSWYLANDMQFYCILSPLIILLLYSVPSFGTLVCTALVLASSAACGLLAFKGLYDQDMYIKPLAHVSPYVLGMLTGFFLHARKRKFDMRWYCAALTWLVVTVLALFVVFCSVTVESETDTRFIVSAALRNIVWAICICWVVIACVTGNGGVVNTILSWSAFVGLGRLAYSIYLINIMVLVANMKARHTVFYYAYNHVITLFLGVSLQVHLVATFVTFFYEVPIVSARNVLGVAISRREGKCDDTKSDGKKRDDDVKRADANDYELLGGAVGNKK